MEMEFSDIRDDEVRGLIDMRKRMEAGNGLIAHGVAFHEAFAGIDLDRELVGRRLASRATEQGRADAVRPRDDGSEAHGRGDFIISISFQAFASLDAGNGARWAFKARRATFAAREASMMAVR